MLVSWQKGQSILKISLWTMGMMPYIWAPQQTSYLVYRLGSCCLTGTANQSLWRPLKLTGIQSAMQEESSRTAADCTATLWPGQPNYANLDLEKTLFLYSSSSRAVGYNAFGKSLSPNIFTLPFITVAELKLRSSNKNNFKVGVTTTWGTVLKGCSISRLRTTGPEAVMLAAIKG